MVGVRRGLAVAVGCHDPQRTFPAGRVTLTRPIESRRSTKDAHR
jgi:hypothetical protein